MKSYYLCLAALFSLSSIGIQAQSVSDYSYHNVAYIDELIDKNIGSLDASFYVHKESNGDHTISLNIQKRDLCHNGSLYLNYEILLDNKPHYFIEHFRGREINSRYSDVKYGDYQFRGRYFIRVNTKPPRLNNVPFRDLYTEEFNREYLQIETLSNFYSYPLSSSTDPNYRTSQTLLKIESKYIGNQTLRIRPLKATVYEYESDPERDPDLITRDRNQFLNCVEETHGITVDRQKYWPEKSISKPEAPQPILSWKDIFIMDDFNKALEQAKADKKVVLMIVYQRSPNILNTRFSDQELLPLINKYYIPVALNYADESLINVRENISTTPYYLVLVPEHGIVHMAAFQSDKQSKRELQQIVDAIKKNNLWEW